MSTAHTPRARSMLVASLGGLCLSVAASGALAQSMKPGLWEHRFTMKSQSGEMEKQVQEMQRQLATMPPSQRKQMEAMLASQGLSMSPGGGAQTMRVCISPEQAARLSLPQKDDGSCQQRILERSGQSLRMAFSCAGDPPTEGEGEYTFKGDGAYQGKATMRTMARGKPERYDMTQQGKWLGSDCGKLKPLPN